MSICFPRPTRTRRLPADSPVEEDAVRQARQILANCPYAELQQVACQRENETLQLTGQVGSFYLKQLAQEIVRKVNGVGQIDNQLVVDSW